MTRYTLEEHGHVAVLTMDAGENRFNPDTLRKFTAALDTVEEETQATALIVQSAHEKIWSNGLDVTWLLQEIQASGDQAVNTFMASVYTLLRRVLTFPMPTLACINGHAFGAGAFLAFAHDFRFMRADRGWICFPEADLGVTLGPVFLALAKRVIPLPLLEEMQYTVRRLDAATAETRGVITRACPQESLREDVLAYAGSLTRPREIISKMKQETLAPTIQAIDQAISELAGTEKQEKHRVNDHV